MKILIVKTSAIGDVIQTFPVIEYLRQRFPNAAIHWIVEKAGASLVESHPFVDKALVVDTKKWRKQGWKKEKREEIARFFSALREEEYDLLFDLQGNAKSGLFTLLARAKEKIGFGIRSVPEKINLLAIRKRIEVPSLINVRERYLQIAKKYFRDISPFQPQGIILKISLEEEIRLKNLLSNFLRKPVVMVCFGSNWPNKQLSEATLKNFLQQVKTKDNPYFLFIYSKKKIEQSMAEELHQMFQDSSQIVGDLSLPLWQALMSRVDLVIAMDSAGLHLCGTTSTPSFSIFGPSSSRIYKPLGEHHVAFQGICPYGRNFTKRCPVLRTCPTGACMRSLTPQQIIDAKHLKLR